MEMQSVSPGPRLCERFLNVGIFLRRGVVNTSSNPPQLEDDPLSAVRDCLFSIFAATLRIGSRLLHPQPEDAPCRGDTDPPHST